MLIKGPTMIDPILFMWSNLLCRRTMRADVADQAAAYGRRMYAGVTRDERTIKTDRQKAAFPAHSPTQSQSLHVVRTSLSWVKIIA